MSEKKYEFKKINDLDIKGEYVGDVYYKPRFVPYILTLLGLAFLLMKNVMGVIMCILFSGFGLLLIFWVKDHKVLSVYTKCIVILDDKNNEGVVIDNDDIDEWNVGLKEANRIDFTIGGQLLSRNSFKPKAAEKYLNMTMPEKNTINKPVEDEDSFLKWLIASIKNLINKVKK